MVRAVAAREYEEGRVGHLDQDPPVNGRSPLLAPAQPLDPGGRQGMPNE